MVACDNVNDLPTGYMGHSAIVVDSTHIIEALPGIPSIRKSKITEFLKDHPRHVQYRPNDKKVGKNAAQWARKYRQQHRKNLKQGVQKPVFTFFSMSPLDDSKKAIYCSKLVWLSYFYGAKHRFPNDFLWFSPEDLATRLSKDSAFKLVHKHPEFRFKLNT